jgi:hypothetical protein
MAPAIACKEDVWHKLLSIFKVTLEIQEVLTEILLYFLTYSFFNIIGLD